MTGESKNVSVLNLVVFVWLMADIFSQVLNLLQVHKDHKAPFLMSGCKVADGVGTMLVR